jgi:DNA-binding response OmpR family regulator
MVPQKRILSIGNDQDTSSMISVFLEPDYEVISTLTLADGLEVAKRECFDLYLLDMGFPNSDGLQLCKQIRTFDHTTPIIFCSGYKEDFVRQQALQNGAHAFFIKPVDLDILAEAIAMHLTK